MELRREIDGIKDICAYINQHEAEIMADLQRLVEIPSVKTQPEEGMPFGRECARVLETALDIARGRGLRVENCGNWYGLAHWGNGPRCIGIFSHLDVVSAGEDWIYEPYTCTEKDGWLIGRGVGDDKIAAVIGIYTLCALRDLGLGKNARFTVFFGCDEESGMSDVDQYVSEKKQPDICLVPDIRFPVCIGERGIIKSTVKKENKCKVIRKFSGGEKVGKVPGNCTARLVLEPIQIQQLMEQAGNEERITAVAENDMVTISAHGQTTSVSGADNGINAIGLLADFLLRAVSLPEEDMKMLEELTAVATGYQGEGMGLACSDERSGPLNCVCVFAELLEETLELNFDTRYPVSFQGAVIQERLYAYFKDHGWKLEKLTDSPPRNTLDMDDEIEILSRCWSDISGETRPPFVIGGGTYARRLHHAVGYGPDNGTRCPFLPEGHGGIHGPDEARELKGIWEAFAAYIHACNELSK